MDDCKVILKQELWQKIGVQVAQLNSYINEDNDIDIHGSLKLLSEEKFAQYKDFQVKANLCDAENNILYTIGDYCERDLALGYDVFRLFFAKIDRFVSVEELACIEIFPSVKKI